MVLPNSQARGHRPALDGLRAFALVTIVLYHLGLPGLPGGFLSVDLFFVLSGYLITGLLFDAHDRFGRIDLARFWRRRARRLLPALLLLLVVVPFAVRRWRPAADVRASPLAVIGGWTTIFHSIARAIALLAVQRLTSEPPLHAVAGMYFGVVGLPAEHRPVVGQVHGDRRR